MARERGKPGFRLPSKSRRGSGVGTWIPVADGYDERWGPQDDYAETGTQTLLTLTKHGWMTPEAHGDDARASISMHCRAAYNVVRT